MKIVRVRQRGFSVKVTEALARLKAESGISLEFGDPPDLVEVDAFAMIGMIRNGALEPLGRLAARDGLDLDDFPQALIDRFRASDVVYAIPVQMNVSVLHYRRDWLDRYGIEIPRDLNALRLAAIDVQESLRRDGRTDVTGFAGVGVAGYSENFLPLGESIFPSWGWRWNRGAGDSPRLHEAATVEALEWYVDLLQLAGAGNGAIWSRGEARRAFFDGRAGFLIDHLSAGKCARMGGFGQGTIATGMMMIPAGPTGRPEPGLEATAIGISRSSTVIDEAWEVIKLLISPESLLDDAITCGSSLTVRDSVSQMESLLQQIDPEQQMLVRNAGRYARINRPMIAGGTDFGDIAGAAAEAAIAGLQTPDEALRVGQAMIDSLSWSH